MQATNPYARIFAIFKAKGLSDPADQRALIGSWTNGRTESVKEMTDSERRQFTNAISSHKVINDPADVMRKKAIWILASMGSYTTSDGRVYQFVDAIGKPKMHDENGLSIHGFIKAVGYKKESLMSYKINELPKLITQLDQFRKHTDDSLASKAVAALKTEMAV
jgi:hypothetical protein